MSVITLSGECFRATDVCAMTPKMRGTIITLIEHGVQRYVFVDESVQQIEDAIEKAVVADVTE